MGMFDDNTSVQRGKGDDEEELRWQKIQRVFRFIAKVFIVFYICTLFYRSYESKQLVETMQANNFVSYTTFMDYVENNEVDRVVIYEKEVNIRFLLLTDETRQMTAGERNKIEYEDIEYYWTVRGTNDDYLDKLLEHDIFLIYEEEYSEGHSPFYYFLSDMGYIITIVTVILMAALCNMVYSQMGPDAVKVEIVKQTNVKFKDIIGHDETIKELEFMVKLLKDPLLGVNTKARTPKGILFSGDPGTGKTLIAKAIAGEAGVPFVYMNASQFIEMYVGLGARRVRSLFKKARAHAPCVIFIDEIDAIGRNRNDASVQKTSEDTQTLNALLQELDGFSTEEGIFVIAATNNPQILDSALTRSGRFDREIVVPKPKNWQVRSDMFRLYLKGKRLSNDVDFEKLAKQTVGFTGADISAVCNEAALIAIENVDIENNDEVIKTEKKRISTFRLILERLNLYDDTYTDTVKRLEMKEKFQNTEPTIVVTMDNLEEAIDKKLLKGNRNKTDDNTDVSEEEKQLTMEDRKIVAWHEAGHAVMSYLRKKPIARVTIKGTTTGVGGFVLHTDTATQFLTKADFETEIMIGYAGRASEEVKWGKDKISIGASNDIENVTKELCSYFNLYGFDVETSGMYSANVLSNYGFVDKSFIFERVRLLSQKFYADTREMIESKFNYVNVLAEALLLEQTIAGDVVQDLLDKVTEDSNVDIVKYFEELHTKVMEDKDGNIKTEFENSYIL